MPCTFCQEFVEGVARVGRTLRDQNKFLTQVFRYLEAIGAKPAGAKGLPVHRFQKVFATISKFVNDDAIEGLRHLLEISKVSNRGKNLAALFNDAIWKPVAGATLPVEEFLVDFRKIVVGLGGETQAKAARLFVLTDSLTGWLQVRGQWYVNKFVLSGLFSVDSIEMFEMITTAGKRSVDIMLKQAVNGMRYFELKSGLSFSAKQAIAHFEKLAGGGWRELRFVINYEAAANKAAVMAEHATELVDTLLSKSAPTTTQDEILNSIRTATKLPLPQGSALSHLNPADAKTVTDYVWGKFFLDFSVPIPLK